RLEPELNANRTTLIFTNVRSLAERLVWSLRRRYPAWGDQIAVHHSAVAAARRRLVERRLKQGRPRVIVSSTSLELGIGIGTADEAFTLVCQAHPYRSLSRPEFDRCLEYLSGRRTDGQSWLPARLRWQENWFLILDQRTARLLRRNLGTILTEEPRPVRQLL